MTVVVVRAKQRIIMEGTGSSSSSSMINSRATAIKTILLAAWRGKLSNEEWENRIRKVLPRGVNGDVYDLADCLLKQALVGPVPNQLFISYLNHAVKCELVSHGAVLSSIAHQSTNIRSSPNFTPNRTSSIICLMEFLKTFRDRISCKGTEIDCLNLCHSLGQLIYWLLECIQHSLDFMIGTNTLSTSTTTSSTATSLMATPCSLNPAINTSNNNNNYNPTTISAQNESIIEIMDLCTETIQYFIDRPFTKSLLFISKIEYCKEFDEILKTVQVIQQKLNSSTEFQLIQERNKRFKILHQLDIIFNSRDMHPSVVAAQQLRCIQMHRIRSTKITSANNFDRGIQQSLPAHDSTTSSALFNSLYSLVAFDVILRSARPHKLLARQIATITNFKSAPIDMTYCELIRVCIIGLIDADGTAAKYRWACFTFLKMPKLVIELGKLSGTNERIHQQANQETAPSDCLLSPNQATTLYNDLKIAFKRLDDYYSPILNEAQHKCKWNFACLLDELEKNDAVLKSHSHIRQSEDFKKILHKRRDSEGGQMLLKIEQMISSMLSRTFDVEQDPLLLYSILGQLVAGNQFEFTFSAAASTGRMQMFVEKLVEHNELNRIPRNDSPKCPQIQALIFDMTFLILTHIAQQYGPEVISSDQSATFNKWYNDCYNPNTRINCPKEMLKNSDNEVVSSLIKQLLNPDEGIQMKSVDWREVCVNIPKAVSDILIAWNQGHLSDTQMDIFIERIKSKMCCLSVITATWLQSYIRTLNGVERDKPISLIQKVLTKASEQAKQQRHQTGSLGESATKSESRYAERSSLMCSILKKILFELNPKAGRNSHQNASTSQQHQQSKSSSANNVASKTNSSSNSSDSDQSLDETAYQSINDKFITTLTTQDILLSNVKQCLSRGWLDHKSLSSLNSLFKMIGSESFTNLIVEQILTSHESPSDLSRAVDITFGLFHLDIEACAFALLKDTIPSWLMGEKKQALLNQPRAFALAHLTVMTVIEVFDNLGYSRSCANSATQEVAATNGIKQETSNAQQRLILMDANELPNPNGPREAKRIKLGPESSTVSGGDKHLPEQVINQHKLELTDISERSSKFNGCIADLMRLFKEIMSDPVVSQRSLFPVLFLQRAVVCAREGSTVITSHLQPEILLDIINLFSSELTFELVLAISNLSTTNCRKYAARAMCQLAQVKESKQLMRQSSAPS